MSHLISAVTIAASVATAVYLLYQHFRNLNELRNEARPVMHNLQPKCEICLDDVIGEQKITLNCSHNFHKDCLGYVFNQVLKNKRSCPKCREFVSETLNYSHQLS